MPPCPSQPMEPDPRRRARRPATSPAILAAATAAFVLVLAGCLPSSSRSSRSAGAETTPGGAAPAAAPTATGPTPKPSFVAPTPTPGPTFLVYTVKSGDSLNSIAHHFGTTGRSIAYWNGATYPSLDPESDQYAPGLLKVGWTLQIIPNVTFDEQTLPEPSDLIDDTPSEALGSDGAP